MYAHSLNILVLVLVQLECSLKFRTFYPGLASKRCVVLYASYYVVYILHVFEEIEPANSELVVFSGDFFCWNLTGCIS